MIAIISPAKTQDFESPSQTPHCSDLRFKKDTLELRRELKDYSIKDIASLMSISEKIAELNYKRFQQFDLEFEANSKQALTTFKGDVYKPFQLDDYTDDDFLFAQKHIRMLSGFYGLIRPFDMIQPYRLEMKTKLRTIRGKNLYEFWGNRLTQSLKSDLLAQGDNILINLASNEYWKVIDKKELNAEIITPVFLEKRPEGEPKIIALFSKKARGAMSDYLVRKQLSDPEQLKKFNWEGYQYSPQLSDENQWIFIR